MNKQTIFFVLLFIIFLPEFLFGGIRWEIYGDKFMENGEFYRAITMFHLAFFDYVDQEDKCRVLIKSGEAYIKAGYFEKALAEYDRAETFCTSKARLLYLRGRLFFLKKNYGMAADLWGRLKGTKFKFLEGVSLVMDGDRKGWILLEKYSKDAGINDAGELDNLRQEKIPYRSPVLASILSAILPGAGQIYTEHYGEAGMAFTINALFGFLIWQSLKKAEEIPHYGYVETGFWTFVGMGFYLGNIYGAALSAKQFNLYYKIQFKRKFLMILKNRGFSLGVNF